jgi:Mrp family chromosome partitioning ATPase
MMTIPFFSGKSIRRMSRGLSKDLALTPWRMEHFIRPFAESIRDRLGLYFERSKITHKPKLIGVTGFHTGGGVSTLAGGLAAALSEVGDGRVLLVDMNVANGKAHSFSEGLPVISLNSSLKLGNKLEPSADNLYLAQVEPAAPGAGSLLLKKLFELIPNLKGSDFDYIVFDLPLLGQTTPAAAMGGLLDTVLVVVEAEANSREEVKRGHRDLIASGANVSTIFNKARAYGPKALVGAV